MKGVMVWRLRAIEVWASKLSSYVNTSYILVTLFLANH